MKNKIRLLGLAIPLMFSLNLHAQSVGQQYSLQFYKQGRDSANFHSSLRDYNVIPEFQLPEDTSGKKRSWVHRKLLREHLFEFKNPEYFFYADFLPDMLVGRSSDNNTIWQNTRGAQVGGRIGKFSFQSSFFENQAKLPLYLDQYGKSELIVPAQGTIRPYGSNGVDYNYASALLNYDASKYLNVQLGYDKNFIGDGYRSMLLSDNSFNYPFLKLTANVGRVKYMVMWAQFMDLKQPRLYKEAGYRKKWGVFHYLDWNVTDKFSVGVFESVIWQDDDSSGKRGFDVSYLTPIAFLRPVEFSVGSSDNALMGFNLKYDVSPNSTVYGQFVLDEFKLKEMTSGSGWWGNKFGGQVGFRSNNVFHVERLNFLTEVNAARPFTYAQRTSLLNYGHYNQALAHPMGANFVESVNIADYQYRRWYFRGQVNYARYGQDSALANYGKDIFKSYNTRTLEYGNKIGQGVKTDFLYVQGTVAFLVNPKYNLRVELSAASRQEKNVLGRNREMIFQFGVRSTFRQIYYDF